ncbi:MAG: ABC transporter permease [Minwuiales bacterium]|nr:ABC transporter permease [Minwuiales bacterium]
MSAVYLLKRLLLAIPTLFGVLVVVFVLLRVVPGDPITMMVGLTASEEDIARLRELYGFDKPIFTQFLIYLGDVLQGDFGVSITRKQEVLGLILGRLPVTLELSLVAMAIALFGGVTLGVLAVYRPGRGGELLADGFSGLGLAIPDFLWALMFILLFGVLIPLLPISGQIDPRLGFDAVSGFYLFESLLTGDFAAFRSVLSHMVLPAVALTIPLAAIIARVLKSSLQEVLTQDYILLARARGFSRLRIVLREALQNALIPTVTLSGVQFTFLVGGTVLIERIFSYPGLGNMAIEAVINRDLPLIQGIVLTFAVMFIALNLIIDSTYALLNPRVRHG